MSTRRVSLPGPLTLLPGSALPVTGPLHATSSAIAVSGLGCVLL